MEIGYLGMLARDLVEAQDASRPRPRPGPAPRRTVRSLRGRTASLRGRTANLLHRLAWVAEPPWQP